MEEVVTNVTAKLYELSDGDQLFWPKTVLLVFGCASTTFIVSRIYQHVQREREIRRTGIPSLFPGSMTFSQFLLGDTRGLLGVERAPDEMLDIHTARFQELINQGKPPIFYERMPFTLKPVIAVPLALSVFSNKTSTVPRQAIFGRVIPNALIAHETNDEFTKTRKRILAPLFSDRFLRANEPEMYVSIDQVCDYITSNSNSFVDCFDLMHRLAFDIIGRIAFETEFESLKQIGAKSEAMEKASALTVAMKMSISLPPFLFVLLGHAKTMLESRNFFGRFAKELLAKYGEKEHHERQRIISALATAEGGLLSEDDIVDEVITFILAGHETTANSLCWIVFELGKHPEIQADAREQVLKAFGKERVAAKSLEQVPIIKHICMETLRVHPTVPYTARRFAQDTEVLGYTIPGDTSLMFYRCKLSGLEPYLGNVSQDRVVKNPFEFDPLQQEGLNEKKSFAPFGFAPRSCIGMRLAQAEMMLVLVTLLQRFEWTLDPDREVAPTIDITMGPKKTHLFAKFQPLD